MSRTAIRVASVFLCVMLLLASTAPVKISAGTVQNTLGIENDVPGTVVDNTFGIGSGPGGDKLIEIGEKGLANNSNSLLHGAGYIGGGILKWGGYYIGAYDTTPVSYTHLRAHETRHDIVCRLLLEKKKNKKKKTDNANTNQKTQKKIINMHHRP